MLAHAKHKSSCNVWQINVSAAYLAGVEEDSGVFAAQLNVMSEIIMQTKSVNECVPHNHTHTHINKTLENVCRGQAAKESYAEDNDDSADDDERNAVDVD